MSLENSDSDVKTLSRRQFLTTAAIGGVAVTASALGGAVVGGNAVRDAAEIQLAAARARLAKYEQVIAVYEQLIALYEQLEKVGIDTIIAAGMNIVRGALEAVKAGIQIIRAGIAAVETAVKDFQAMLESLRGGADTFARAVTDLSQKFKMAEGIVVAVIGVALPLAESIASFFNAVLSKIPIVGNDLRRAATALSDLVSAIPALVDAAMNRLLKPLHDMFFPLSGDPAVKTSLFDPLTQNLLNPLKSFLGDVETALARWENDFAQPTQKALDDRAKIRKQIAQLKQDSWLA
jgi:hypothetical protein